MTLKPEQQFLSFFFCAQFSKQPEGGLIEIRSQFAPRFFFKNAIPEYAEREREREFGTEKGWGTGEVKREGESSPVDFVPHRIDEVSVS